MPQNKRPKVLTLRDCIASLICVGIMIDLVFLYFFLFNTPDRKGIYFLKIKRPVEATKQFLQAVKEKPFSPFSHLNLGLSYDLQNQPLKALEKYQEVARLFKQFPRFVSFFNLGELNGRLYHIDKALKNYQLSLEFGQETKKIKQNIELLFKQENKSQNKKNQDDKDQNKENKENKENKNQNNQDKGDKNQSGSQLPQPPQKSQADSSLTKEQVQAILKEIEKQESKVRARQFRKKRPSRQSGKKDW